MSDIFMLLMFNSVVCVLLLLAVPIVFRKTNYGKQT